MSLFGMFGAQQPQQQQQPTPAPTPAPARFTPEPPMPGQQQQQQQTQPANPGHDPAIMQQQQVNPAPAPQTLNLADILSQGNDTATNPSEFAASFISALQSQPDPSMDQSAQPVQVNVNDLFTAASGVDLTHGIDVGALVEGLSGENGPQLLQHALQQSQVNTIMMLAPLMNQLRRASAERTADTAVTASSHNMLANAVISEFNSRFAYGDNPLISNMLRGMAETVAKSAPRGTPVNTIVNSLDTMFRGFAQSTSVPGRPDNVPMSAQTDFSNLFK